MNKNPYDKLVNEKDFETEVIKNGNETSIACIELISYLLSNCFYNYSHKENYTHVGIPLKDYTLLLKAIFEP